MARVLLIKCSNMTFYHRGLTFPMGIMSIASVLRREGHEVRILDLRLNQKNSGKDISMTMEGFKPHLVGLSSITLEAPSLHFAASVIKNKAPVIPIIAGGPHPSSFPEEVLQDNHINCVVIGEGEATTLELFNTLLDAGDLEKVKGIAYLRDEKVIFTPPRPPIDDLDALPFPSWDLVEINKYKNWLTMSNMIFRKYMNLFTSRGCPYRCIYCHNIFGKQFHARSPENVIEEITTVISRYNINNFEVLDDIFNMDKERALRIYELILQKGLKISIAFPNGLRCDTIDEEHLRLMRNAGVNIVSVAVETASPRLQRIIRKNLNIRKVNEFINGCFKFGIFTRGFLMMGFPTETRQEILETINFAINSRLHTAYFFLVVPFKGTELYRICNEKLKSVQMDFSHYSYVTSAFNLSEVSDEELFQLHKYAYKKFYIDPMRIIRVVKYHPVKQSLPVNLMSVLKLAFRSRKDSPLLPKFLTN